MSNQQYFPWSSNDDCGRRQGRMNVRCTWQEESNVYEREHLGRTALLLVTLVASRSWRHSFKQGAAAISRALFHAPQSPVRSFFHSSAAQSRPATRRRIVGLDDCDIGSVRTVKACRDLSRHRARRIADMSVTSVRVNFVVFFM
jgi:hypothetical protein